MEIQNKIFLCTAYTTIHSFFFHGMVWHSQDFALFLCCLAINRSAVVLDHWAKNQSILSLTGLVFFKSYFTIHFNHAGSWWWVSWIHFILERKSFKESRQSFAPLHVDQADAQLMRKKTNHRENIKVVEKSKNFNNQAMVWIRNQQIFQFQVYRIPQKSGLFSPETLVFLYKKSSTLSDYLNVCVLKVVG